MSVSTESRTLVRHVCHFKQRRAVGDDAVAPSVDLGGHAGGAFGGGQPDLQRVEGVGGGTGLAGGDGLHGLQEGGLDPRAGGEVFDPVVPGLERVQPGLERIRPSGGGFDGGVGGRGGPRPSSRSTWSSRPAAAV